MKRFICLLASVLLMSPVAAFAQLTVPQGGIGTTTVPTNYVVLGGSSSLRITAVATSSLGLPTFSGNNTWTGLNIFSNASTSLLTVSTNQWLTALATPAGTILAVDPNGKIIATSTSAGGVTSVTGTYPIISSGGATPAISTAFGTTTQNNFSLLNTFANATSTLFTAGTTWFTSNTGSVLSTSAGGLLQNTTVSSPLSFSGATLSCPTCSTATSPATSTNPLMATYFVATSTTQASLFPYASTTALTVGGTGTSTVLLGNVVISGNLQVNGAVFYPVSITMGGNLNMATNNITNVGTITATAGVFTSTLQIPVSATSPSLSVSGQVAIETTAATSSMNYYDGTAVRMLSAAQPKMANIASSTLAYLNSSFGATGSTTIIFMNNPYPSSIVGYTCRVFGGTGTVMIRFGNNGAASTTPLTCTTTGAYTAVSSNNTFAFMAPIWLETGSTASFTGSVNITALIRNDAN